MNYVLVLSDDWTGLYINGILSCEGSSLNAHSVLELVCDTGEPVNSVNSFTCDQDWIEKKGRFPTNLIDVRLAK